MKTRKKYRYKGRKRQTGSEATVRGVLRKTRRGFGFLIPENGTGDIYISARKLNGAMNGDLVDVIVYLDSRRGDSREGYVRKIVERAADEMVGTFARLPHGGLVIPDDKTNGEEVRIANEDFGKAKPGDKVVARITKYPDRRKPAEGVITEVLGRAGDASGVMRALVRSFGIIEDFPPEAIAEAETTPQCVSDEDIAKVRPGKPPRRDLRKKTIFTIDGADSKDFDDAVSIDRLDNGHYLLGVHIADVCHYVAAGSAIDMEALNRGTSVYLPDAVIPMLPAALSNDICSLNEGVDRLTLSVDMEVDENGEVVRHELYESVIHSTARLVYDDVSDLLEKDDAFQRKRYRHIAADIALMGELAHILEGARHRRGSIDFDLREATVALDAHGLPTDIKTYERRTANRMIEEFMILANETVAKQFAQMHIPFVYRVHERPDTEKMRAFMKLIAQFGLKLKGRPDNVTPLALSELLHTIKGQTEEDILSKVCLRSMQKAVYGVECLGHFGLALKYYCHFTSPIRRYPDLIIHRIIKESLAGKLPAKRVRIFKKKTDAAAKRSSGTEQRATMLEREAEKRMKAEFMTRHIGEEYDAIISGVTSFGLFAELENTVEGMIGFDTLTDDYYDFEADHYRIVGQESGKIYALGDRVRIIVTSVDADNREINFSLSDPAAKR
ncbi:MAG: ribonuclease R [Clostridiales Family XIII bacterium]|jgi:ribonuclease R|nr:ribonuclease R [Clostridiales Family XIII bacterium]